MWTMKLRNNYSSDYEKREKNRHAAQKCRLKKQQKFMTLINDNQNLKTQLHNLQIKLIQTDRENLDLKKIIQEYNNMVESILKITSITCPNV